MRDEEIHIGDIVRIREWDDMANEFNIDNDGDIRIAKDLYFTKLMKRLCGKVLTVSSMFREEDRKAGFLFSEKIGWFICSEMLEPYVEEEYNIATDDEINELFQVG